jgi:hypothetical protein
VENFIRTETDHMIRVSMQTTGAGVGELVHHREPTTPENQPVIRMNQDTLYSGIVLDLSQPVPLTLPEVGGRCVSAHVVNQDHYMFVETKPGTYRLTQESVGTRFAAVTIVLVRTFLRVRQARGWKAVSLPGAGASGRPRPPAVRARRWRGPRSPSGPRVRPPGPGRRRSIPEALPSGSSRP